MPPTLLLFDIDGTLLLTRGASAHAMRAAGARVFGETFTFDGISFSGRLDPSIFAEAAARNAVDAEADHHDRFRETYLRELEAALSADTWQPHALPGVHELLGELRGRVARGEPITLGLLSGNYRAAAPKKLQSVGIDPDWFSLTAFGDDAATRPDLVALALDRYEAMAGAPLAPRRAIVLGDTPHDIDCARAHGCVAFAIATGRYTLDQLVEAGADIAVADLRDPSPLLTRLQ